MFCTKFVQSTSLDLVQFNLQNSDICTHLHGVLAAFQLQFWLQPDNSSQVEKVITQTLVTLSLCWGCLTITAAVSSSVDAYVCRIWTNPATCVRSTVSLPPDAEAYYRAQTFSFLSKAVGKQWVEDTTLRHSGRWFERLLFGRCSGCEFKMAEMRERGCQSVIYCCIQ